MNTTDQLPEPELGYIQTDKSNQPAFSARQMREAMKHTLQARAQVQSEPVAWCIEAQVDGEWFVQYPITFTKQGAELDASLYTPETVLRIRPLAFGDTTPQPAQATQAEVTDGIRPEDFTVDVVVKPMGGFAPVNTQGVRVTHKPTGISVTCDAARSQHTNRQQAFEKLSAILALRPERVPMTGEVKVTSYSEWRRGDVLRITRHGRDIGPFSVGQLVRHDDEDGHMYPANPPSITEGHHQDMS